MPSRPMSTSDHVPEYLEESPAYEEGWTAYQQDLDRTDNPYDPDRDSGAFKDWNRGWSDAMDEAEEVER